MRRLDGGGCGSAARLPNQSLTVWWRGVGGGEERGGNKDLVLVGKAGPVLMSRDSSPGRPCDAVSPPPTLHAHNLLHQSPNQQQEQQKRQQQPQRTQPAAKTSIFTRSSVLWGFSSFSSLLLAQQQQSAL